MNDALRQRLPLIPDLHDRESLRGYLSRLAAANFIESEVHPIIGNLRTVSELLNTVSIWSGIDEQVLAERTTMTVRGAARQVRIGSCLLEPSQILLSTRQICPICIAEGRRVPCSWDLKDLTVCATHGDKLLRKCDRCSQPLTWSATPEDRCACGKPFSEMVSRFESVLAVRHSRLLDRALDIALGLAEDDASVPSIRELLNARLIYRKIAFQGLQELAARSVRASAADRDAPREARAPLDSATRSGPRRRIGSVARNLRRAANGRHSARFASSQRVSRQSRE